MGAKASVTLILVTLGLFGVVSAAWAKKDKVEVTLTAPAAGALYNAPAAVVLSAIAQAKQKNHPIAKVEFFQGTSLVGSVTGPRAGDQYTLSWTGVAAGTYSLTARATNGKGDTDLSDPVSITVNALPSVSLTSPSSNAAFKAPANIPLAVQAADTDGSIANVEYFHGTTSITSLSAPPYSFVWTEVPQGTYALTARVTDNLGGAVTSVAVNVTVTAAEAKLYYIHVDHLNTPRLVADDQQRTVWRWDQQEPFGVNVPDENPSGVGVFELPLRLPGQYYDKETNLHYNFYRDYDPTAGRYFQSDLLGIRAGLNTYLYVHGAPLLFADFFGLLPMPPQPVPAPPSGKGCGTGPSTAFLPDLFFEQCCDRHDDCYDDCKNRPSKDNCDREFANCTMGQCSRRWIAVKFVCEYAAVVYAEEGPKRRGQDAYNRARAKCAAVCKP